MGLASVLLTYTPSTNPIEKLWRRLKQEVPHEHDFGDEREASRRR
ncbi:MAG: hypothetical protein ACLQVF_45270 [Isosphaeraceae bacterium]